VSGSPDDIPRIKPLHGTLLALRQGESLLLIRRTKAPYKGYLGLPGGKMEAGETPLDAARREMLEETGLKRPKPRWLGRVIDLLVEGAPPHDLFILDVFEVTLAEGALSQPSFEGTIVRLPLEELDARADEIIPADVQIIRRLVVERATNVLDLVSVKTTDGYDVKVI